MEIQIMKTSPSTARNRATVQLSDEIFGLEPRADLLHRCVNWQLAKRQRGTHKTKDRSEIWRTGKKMYGQKGGRQRPA
jgi:large subunit ribosomal protein L4